MAIDETPGPTDVERSDASARSSVAGGRLALPWVFRDDPGTPALAECVSSPSPRGSFRSNLDSAVASPVGVAPLTCQGPRHLRLRVAALASAFFGMNAVQRCLSAAVLAPLITIFLWQSPAFATATFCTFVTSICSYEYSWLAHRIHLRVLTKVRWAEQALGGASATALSRNSVDDPHPLSASHDGETHHGEPGSRRGHSSRTNSSESDDCDSSLSAVAPVDANDSPVAAADSEDDVYLSNGHNTPDVDTNVQEYPSDWTASNMSDNIWDRSGQDASFSRCAVSGLAEAFFGNNEWVAGVVISVFISAITSTGFLVYVEYIPEVKDTDLYRLRWFYSIATDFVAALCGAFTPNWMYALICLIEKIVFTLLTMHSTSCPINRFSCGTSLEPSEVFLAGAVVVFLLRLSVPNEARGPSSFLHIALDMLGYLYIIGSLSVIVAFVDDDRLESYRKLLIVLLYVVWASDTGAYLTGKCLEWLKYGHYNPLASHLSKNKDYEGTCGAIVFGVVAMHLSSGLLDVPGSTVAQIGFTVLAVIVGRLGDLFESLLKRAAGVKDSGKLIPGHGGVLDRIDALMFASLVFARYYAMIVVA